MESNSIIESPYILVGLIIILLGLCIYLYVKLKSEEKSQTKIKEQLKVIEFQYNNIKLEQIESKLNPHLFKNILNSIQSHAYQTYYTIDKLANVLDYMLYDSRKKYVTPKDEFDFALNLIEINKIKLSPLFELKVKNKINESEPLLTQNVFAPMISIALIENAFKHADLQSPDSFISITFTFENNEFGLTVANKISSKPTLEKERKGLGIESMEQRLEIIYKGCYKLERFTEENVFIAQLKINLLEHKAKMLAAR